MHRVHVYIDQYYSVFRIFFFSEYFDNFTNKTYKRLPTSYSAIYYAIGDKLKQSDKKKKIVSSRDTAIWCQMWNGKRRVSPPNDLSKIKK